MYSALFILSALIASFSQILLKKSALIKYNKKIHVYLNPLVITAYGLFFLSTILTVVGYRQVPISIGGFLTSSSYIFVPALSYIFFKETITKRTFIGLCFILAGIIIVNL